MERDLKPPLGPRADPPHPLCDRDDSDATEVVVFSSGGKDSLSALVAFQHDPAWRPAALLTTFNQAVGRIAMHGTRRVLARAQADALGLPLVEVELPERCSNEVYESRVAAAIRSLDVQHVAFGDLFLADIRDYRLRQMDALGLVALFPIWGKDTGTLAMRLVDEGWKIIITCVDAQQLHPDFLGREFDYALLRDLPAGIDPCGENGEFHTFVSACPAFARAIEVTSGARVCRDGRFHFLDLLPG